MDGLRTSRSSNFGSRSRIGQRDYASLRRYPSVPTQPEVQVSSAPAARATVLKHPRTVAQVRPALPRQTKSIVLKRTVKRSVVKPPIRRVRRVTPRKSLVASALLVMIMIGFTGVLASKQLLSHAKDVKGITSSLPTVQQTDASVDERLPTMDAVNEYHTELDAPRVLTIPAMQIISRVVALTVNPSGNLQAPYNIHDTGWYNQSAKPGSSSGAVVIDGHLSGPTQPGVFYDLAKLQAGQLLQLERGDGKLFTYKVVKSQVLDAADVQTANLLKSIDAKKPGLNLVTTLDAINGTGRQAVVYAVQQ